MDIQSLKENWQKLGEQDSLWAVLSWPEKKNKRWNEEEFFKTGQREIDLVMNSLIEQKLLPDNDRALDFGCGVGRLTQPLAGYFKEAVGVDIAPAMIERSTKFNSKENCKFVLNIADDLKILSDDYFSFIYSRLTFQHMAPELTKKYLQEFVRILKPGGVAIFVQPYKKVLFKDSLQKLTAKNLLKMILPFPFQNFIRNFGGKILNKPVMELHSISKKDMSDWLKQKNVTTINIDEFGDLGGAWICYRYLVKKD